MEDKKVLKIIDNNGQETEYTILIAFYWTKTKKNYLVYTDNTRDSKGILNIFASIYYPDDDTRLDLVKTDEEWEEIERRIKSINHIGRDTNE